MSTQTTNYSFNKPTVGGDDDTWGTDFTGGDDPSTDASPGLNGNWSKLDVIFKALEDRVAAAETAVEARKIPIGGLYLSVSDTDPATTLGYGTWTAHAQGRAIVGVGASGTSDNWSWSVGTSVGAETHALAVSELASHTHGIPPLSGTTAAAGDISDIQFPASEDSDLPMGASNSFSLFSWGTDSRFVNTDAGSRTGYTARLSWSHSHSLTTNVGTSAANGSSTPHNNVQPSIGVYVWRRTA